MLMSRWLKVLLVASLAACAVSLLGAVVQLRIAQGRTDRANERADVLRQELEKRDNVAREAARLSDELLRELRAQRDAMKPQPPPTQCDCQGPTPVFPRGRSMGR